MPGVRCSIIACRSPSAPIFPVESPNPFPGLAAAISREDAAGQPPGGWLPGQRLSMEQAFAAFTTGGAHAGFAEDRSARSSPAIMPISSILDRDIFEERDQREISGTRVLETYVAGRKVWERNASPPERRQAPGR